MELEVTKSRNKEPKTFGKLVPPNDGPPTIIGLTQLPIPGKSGFPKRSIPLNDLIHLLFATIGLVVSIRYIVPIEFVWIIFGIGSLSVLISGNIDYWLDAEEITIAFIVWGILVASLWFEMGAFVERIIVGTWIGFLVSKIFAFVVWCREEKPFRRCCSCAKYRVP